MRVLLTGAAGFIGTATAAELRRRDLDVVAVDLLLPQAHGAATRAAPPEGLHLLDTRRATEWAPLLDGIDVVVHLAAMVGAGVTASDLPLYAGHNDLGTAAVLAAMHERGVRRLVQASSMVVYGEGRYRCPEHGEQAPAPRSREALESGDFENPCPVCGGALGWQLVDEAAPLDPRSSYAASKVAQEHYASAWARQSPGAAVSLRYHNVYGAGMPRDTPYSGVAAMFRSSLERGEAPVVFEDGGQRQRRRVDPGQAGGDADVLGQQRELEAGRVGAGDDVAADDDLGDEAAAGRGVDDLEQRRRFHAEALTDVQRLGGGGVAGGGEEVVEGLDRVPRAEPAGAEDPPPSTSSTGVACATPRRPRHRPSATARRSRRAGRHRRPARRRPRRRTAQPLGDRAVAGRAGGAHVDDHRPAAAAGRGRPPSRARRAHDPVVGQHRDDDLAVAEVGGPVAAGPPCSATNAERRGVGVKDDQVDAGLARLRAIGQPMLPRPMNPTGVRRRGAYLASALQHLAGARKPSPAAGMPQ